MRRSFFVLILFFLIIFVCYSEKSLHLCRKEYVGCIVLICDVFRYMV